MYMLKDRGIISEVKCGSNFEYVLEKWVQHKFPREW